MAPGLSGHPEPSTQEDMQLPGTCTRRQRTLSKSWWLKEAGEDGGTADHNCHQLLMGGERCPKQTHAYQPENPGDAPQICWATSLVLLFIAKILFRPPGYTSGTHTSVDVRGWMWARLYLPLNEIISPPTTSCIGHFATMPLYYTLHNLTWKNKYIW